MYFTDPTTTAREKVQGWLDAANRNQGTDLRLNENDLCAFVYEKFHVVIQTGAESGGWFLFYSTFKPEIEQDTDDDHRSIRFFSALLKLGNPWYDLSIYPSFDMKDGENFLLSNREFVDDHDSISFLHHLERFIGNVVKIAEALDDAAAVSRTNNSDNYYPTPSPFSLVIMDKSEVVKVRSAVDGYLADNSDIPFRTMNDSGVLDFMYRNIPFTISPGCRPSKFCLSATLFQGVPDKAVMQRAVQQNQVVGGAVLWLDDGELEEGVKSVKIRSTYEYSITGLTSDVFRTILDNFISKSIDDAASLRDELACWIDGSDRVERKKVQQDLDNVFRMVLALPVDRAHHVLYGTLKDIASAHDSILFHGAVASVMKAASEFDTFATHLIRSTIVDLALEHGMANHELVDAVVGGTYLEERYATNLLAPTRIEYDSDEGKDFLVSYEDFTDGNTRIVTSHVPNRKDVTVSIRTITDFDQWKQDNQHENGKTTLHQEVALAQRLYDEAENAKDGISVEGIISALESTPLDHELVSWKGIHVDWFLDVFCNTEYAKRLKEFGCELWFIRKVCIIEYLRRNAVSSGPFLDNIGVIEPQRKNTIVQDATTFISYTGNYTFSHLIEMLGFVRGEYVWLDIFCVDQFAWTGCKKSFRVRAFSKELMDGLGGRIRDIKRTALLLAQWDDIMMTLGQIWVLWEVFNTVQAKADFRIVLPEKEREQYCRTMETREDFDMIQRFLSEIDCEKALAECEEDRDIILGLMKQQGADAVNHQVTVQVRDWLLEAAGKHSERLQMVRNNEIEADRAVRFCKNYSRLLIDQGRHDEAENCCRECVDKFREQFGDQHAATLNAIRNLAFVVGQRAKYKEESELCREVLTGFRQLGYGTANQQPTPILQQYVEQSNNTLKLYENEELLAAFKRLNNLE